MSSRANYDKGEAFELEFSGEPQDADGYGLGGRSNGEDGAEAFGADLGFHTTEPLRHASEGLDEELLKRLRIAKVTRDQACALLDLVNGHCTFDAQGELVVPPNLDRILRKVGGLQRKELVAYIRGLGGTEDPPEVREALAGIGRSLQALGDVDENNGELNPFGIES